MSVRELNFGGGGGKTNLVGEESTGGWIFLSCGGNEQNFGCGGFPSYLKRN